MARSNVRLRGLASLVLCALACTASGCLSCLHPLPPVRKEQFRDSQCLPQCCKNKVYIFIHDGCDPLDPANIEGVCEHLQKMGFIKTYYGEWLCSSYFADEIRRIHKEQPEARFVLIGYGRGARRSRDLAAVVAKDHIPVDLLVYLGGSVHEKSAADRPANVLRTINIQGASHRERPPALHDAVNVTYPDVGKQGAPTHPSTLDLLVKELLIVASRVPAIEKVPPPDPHPEPTPRAIVPPNGPADEWDFLKPERLPAPKPAPEQLPTPKEVKGVPARTTGKSAAPAQDPK